jgi:hypothetical protein
MMNVTSESLKSMISFLKTRANDIMSAEQFRENIEVF